MKIYVTNLSSNAVMSGAYLNMDKNAFTYKNKIALTHKKIYITYSEFKRTPQNVCKLMNKSYSMVKIFAYLDSSWIFWFEHGFCLFDNGLKHVAIYTNR